MTFNAVPGWVTPAKQTVTVVAGEKALATGVYESLGADFSGTPLTGKPSLRVKFTDQSTGPVKSWSWDFGDGGTSKVQNPVHAYNQPGTYTVPLTVKNGTVSSTKTRTDYIAIYAALKADFSAEPTSGKKPLSVQFSDQSTGPVTSRLWNFGDKTTSTDRNTAHNYTRVGTYTVKLTVKGPGGTNTATRSAYIQVQK